MLNLLRTRFGGLPVALLACLALCACRLDDGPAGIVFRGGSIHTADPDRPEVQAVAVREGRVVWTGSSEAAGRWIGRDTRVIELGTATLLPGFADAHLHLLGLGDALAEVDLVGSRSYAEVVARIAARAASQAPGSWVVGRGWDQNDWDEPLLPHHAALSAAVPEHPVWVRRIDGHAGLANARALALAGIDGQTRAPDGGRIHRDDSGAATGVLIDLAMSLVSSLQPELPPAERRRRVDLAVQHLLARGVTAVHEAGLDREGVELLEQMARDGELPLRVHAMLRASELALRQPAHVSGWPSDDLTGDGVLALRAIKLSADGALGSRGAALLSPYSDEPDQRGLLLADHAAVLELARFAAQNGWQLCTHAIGDRANRIVLDAYEQALSEHPVDDHRFRIEHAQIVDPADLPRFAELGVLPCMQAQHQTSDMPWAGARLGPERLAGAYAWRDLLDTGVIIPGGSDAPVEAVHPLAAFHAAVTRQDLAGQPDGGWYPEQVMTRQQALLHSTLWPAMAAFREHDLGSITPGKRADLVLLSGDPMSVPMHEIPALQVLMTVFNGRVVFEAQPQPTGTP
ncbi:MAG: amidohydrolase [Planctomycetota bacterium]|nr:MAG: amidohydrolase [Planctomycetota bacterium]